MVWPPENAETRSRSVKVATAIQCLFGLGFAGVGAILLIPCRPKNDVELFACAALLDVPAAWPFVLIAAGLVALLGARGLWKGLVWGWWISLLIDFGTVVACVYHIYQVYAGGFGHVRYIGYVIAFSIPVVLLFSTTVRKFCWGPSSTTKRSLD